MDSDAEKWYYIIKTTHNDKKYQYKPNNAF